VKAGHAEAATHVPPAKLFKNKDELKQDKH